MQEMTNNGKRSSVSGTGVSVLVLAIVAIICWPLIGSESVLMPMGPRSGEDEISLPVEPLGFNQLYVGADGYWGKFPMGLNGCYDSIARSGCLITVFSSVLDYYQIRLYVHAWSSSTGSAQMGVDPGIINDWLVEHNGYGPCGKDAVGDCCLEWTQLPDELGLSFYDNQSEYGLTRATKQRIDQALGNGYPVVAGVHWEECISNPAQNENCHWVVIVGKQGTTYRIIDPYNRDIMNPRGIRTFLGQGSLGSYTVDRFVVVSGPVPAPMPLDLRLSADLFAAESAWKGTINVQGNYPAAEFYLRVTNPFGNTYFAYTSNPQSGDKIRFFYSTTKRSIFGRPVAISSDQWDWSSENMPGDQMGYWIWEFWAEDPSYLDQKLGYDFDTLTVTRQVSSVRSAFLSLLLAGGFAVAVAFATYTLAYSFGRG